MTEKEKEETINKWYDLGYRNGENDGYDIGYHDGYDNGYEDGRLLKDNKLND